MKNALLALILAVPAAAAPGHMARGQAPRKCLPHSAVPAQTVKARWRSFAYDGPRHRAYDCVPSLQALDDVLILIDARRGRSQCSWTYGLQADWEALAPVKGPELALSGLVRSLDGKAPWLAGLEDKWRQGAPEETDAVWVRGTLHKSLSDLRACNVYSQTLDYLLDRLPVRSVQQSVFCQTGSSFISLSLEYLAQARRGAAGR